ncbi:MAG TPA: DUF4126 family protein [Gemmatimonadaceae bacterium]
MPVHSDFFFYTSALILSFVSGMRSMMALAVLSLTLTRRPELAPAAAAAPVEWFTLRPLAIVLGLAALGELIADKLPRTPNRIALGPFVGRLALGALAGAALVQLGRINPWIGAACGVIGAIAGTFGMFYLRRYAGRATEISDPYLGAIEDVLAIAIASTVVAMLVG